MKKKLTLALVALITSSAFAAIPKVLPEFKNEKQLAEWREEMAAKHAATSTSDVRSSALDVPSAFYTGKPYIETTGSYAFKYRSYNPELARWTSEDPSGFPDGANSNVYTTNPTSCIDPFGLNELYVNDLNVVMAVVSGWESTGYTFSARLGNYSVNNIETPRDAEQDEIRALQDASAFTNWFNKGWFDQYYGSQGAGTYSCRHNVWFGSGSAFGSDLHLSYGHVVFSFSAVVSEYNNGYMYDVNYTFNDEYNFNPNTIINPIRAWDALQTAGVVSKYFSSGSFNIVYE